MVEVRLDAMLGQSITDHLNHYVLVTDGKGAAVAAAALILVSAVLSSDWLFQYSALGWIGTACAVLSGIAAGIAIYPRTPHFHMGHIFWADILAHGSAMEYWKSLRTLDDDAIGLEFARQNFQLSRVLVSKTKAIRWSLWLFAAACALLFIAKGA